jgi:2-keto-3-deoxy-L-rhamnonate aldolase RhmA
MRTNPVKQALKRGEAVIGTMAMEVKSPGFAQMCAAAGLDFLFIDMEHGTYSLAEAGAMIQMCRQVGVVPLVRVPDLAYHLIARVLDAGAMGVMVPRIETAEQVEAMVSYMRYPPLGVRGSGGSGRAEYGLAGGSAAEMVERLNQHTLAVAQIERKLAIENIESIAAVPGLDVCLIGPVDLSISLGIPGEMDHPLMQEAIAKVVDACTRHGIASGGHLSADALERWWQRGMRMLMSNADVGMLSSGCRQTAAQLKAFLGK